MAGRRTYPAGYAPPGGYPEEPRRHPDYIGRLHRRPRINPVLKWVAIIFGSCLSLKLLALALLLVSAVLSHKDFKPRPPTEEEKGLVLHVSELSEYGIVAEDVDRCGSYAVERELYGPLSVEYEYDSSKSPDDIEELYYWSCSNIYDSTHDAHEAYVLEFKEIRNGAEIEGGGNFALVADNIVLGNEHVIGHMVDEEGEYGTIVVVRFGRIVHYMVLNGWIYVDHQDIIDLLAKIGENSIAYVGD